MEKEIYKCNIKGFLGREHQVQAITIDYMVWLMIDLGIFHRDGVLHYDEMFQKIREKRAEIEKEDDRYDLIAAAHLIQEACEEREDVRQRFEEKFRVKYSEKNLKIHAFKRSRYGIGLVEQRFNLPEDVNRFTPVKLIESA